MKTLQENSKNISNNKLKRNNLICEKYLNNIPTTTIAREMHIGKGTVRNVLKERGIYDSSRLKYRLNPDKISRNRAIINMYDAGMSSPQISNILGMSRSNVCYIIKQFSENDIKQYSIKIEDKENWIRHRKYYFDFDFFADIDTEEKAYWLGFLYADGCITDSSVKIELQKRDFEHLKKFKKAINLDKEITYPKNRNSCLLYFNSVKVVNNLKRLGCCKNKTYKIRFPQEDCIPEYLIHHFMRGYFDGDGCIYARKTKSGVNTFSVVGNDSFINDYKKKLFKGIDKKTDCKNREDNGITSFYLGGNKQISKIYDFLYKDATVFLKRKSDKFKKIINEGRLEAKATEASRVL